MTVLVLEHGAEWPSWAAGLRTRALHSAVEMQAPDESLAAFSGRVASRISRIQEKGRLIAAGYVCSLEAEDQEARASLCRTLLDGLGEGGGAELVVAGGAWEVTGPESEARSRLIELWSGLTMASPYKMVSVRFETPRSESGVFRAASPLGVEHCDAVEVAGAMGGGGPKGSVVSAGRPGASLRACSGSSHPANSSSDRASRPRSSYRAGTSSLPPPVAASLTDTLG